MHRYRVHSFCLPQGAPQFASITMNQAFGMGRLPDELTPQALGCFKIPLQRIHISKLSPEYSLIDLPFFRHRVLLQEAVPSMPDLKRHNHHLFWQLASCERHENFGIFTDLG